MKSIIRLARWGSEQLEEMPIGVGAWCALFVGIVLVRDLIEGFSGSLPLVHPVDFFLHYPLAFINPLLTLAILLSLGSGVPLARVTRIMLVMWSLVLIPPLVDLLLGAAGVVEDKAHIGYAPIFRGEYWDHFLHFFDPRQSFLGTTAGIRVEAFVEVVLAAAYVVLKRRRLGVGVALGAVTALVVYVVSLGYFTWPFHVYNAVTPAAEASLNGMRLFMVEYGIVAREHFDRFSHAAGGMHALLLALLSVVWFGVHRGRGLWRLTRTAAPTLALAALLAAAGLAFGAERFVLAAGVRFAPTLVDWVFMLCGVVAAMAARVGLWGLREGEPGADGAVADGAVADGLSPAERIGALIASVAVAMIASWMVSYAVFTITMVVLAISVLRVVSPFATDRLPLVAQGLRGIHYFCVALVTVAVFGRAETVQALPHRLVVMAVAAAMLAAFHGAGSGRLARVAAQGSWAEPWAAALPVWQGAARRLFGAVAAAARIVRPLLRWVPLAAPWVMVAAYPGFLAARAGGAVGGAAGATGGSGAAWGLAAAVTLLYLLLTAWRRSRGVPAAGLLVLAGAGVLAELGAYPLVVGGGGVETPAVRAALQLGNRLLWSDHIDLALDQFDRVAMMQPPPQTFAAFQNAIGSRAEMHQYDAALKSAQRAVELLPRNADAWVALGDVASLSGSYVRAVEAFTEAVRWVGAEAAAAEAAGGGASVGAAAASRIASAASSQSAATASGGALAAPLSEQLDVVGKAAIASGLAKDARKTLRFMRLGERLAPGEEFFRNGVLSAELSLYGSTAADSLEYYRQRAARFAATSEEGRDARLLQAAAALGAGDAVAALEIYTALAAADPADPLPLYLGARAASSAGDGRGALDFCDRFLALRPRFASAYQVRAQIELTLGESAAAIDDLAHSLQLDARNADIHVQLALLRFESDRAAAAWEGLAALPPRWETRARAKALSEAIRAYLRRRAKADDGSALAALPTVLRRAGVKEGGVLLAAARGLVENRAMAAAAEVFTLAREVAPQDPRPALQFARLLLRAKRYDEAAESAHVAIAAGGPVAEDPAVYSLLAQAYAGAGRDALAAAARRRANELQSASMKGGQSGGPIP
jgi:tetratricopeptide (TPR) repeat protein